MSARVTGGPEPIVLTLDIDAAEYLADLVWSAWLKDKDHGAKEISEDLRAAADEALRDEAFFS